MYLKNKTIHTKTSFLHTHYIQCNERNNTFAKCLFKSYNSTNNIHNLYDYSLNYQISSKYSKENINNAHFEVPKYRMVMDSRCRNR